MDGDGPAESRLSLSSFSILLLVWYNDAGLVANAGCSDDLGTLVVVGSYDNAPLSLSLLVLPLLTLGVCLQGAGIVRLLAKQNSSGCCEKKPSTVSSSLLSIVFLPVSWVPSFIIHANSPGKHSTAEDKMNYGFGQLPDTYEDRWTSPSAGKYRRWFHGLRSCSMPVAAIELGLPASLRPLRSILYAASWVLKGAQIARYHNIATPLTVRCLYSMQ